MVVIPIRQNRFKYQINQGKEHICDQTQLTKLIYPIIPYEQRKIILDFLFRLRNFVILRDEEELSIKELFPTKTTIKKIKVQRKATVNRKNAEKIYSKTKRKSLQDRIKTDAEGLYSKFNKKF